MVVKEFKSLTIILGFMGIKNKVARTLGYPVALITGGALGYGASLFSRFVAEANVKVRPDLANVDFWTAYFSDHATDWVVYHYANEITTAASIAGAAIAVTIYHLASR